MFRAAPPNRRRRAIRAVRGAVRALAERRDLRVTRLLARGARSFLDAHDGHRLSYDITKNGEQLVIERVTKTGSVVFDVGANVGDWTALAVARGANVHAFEISPPTAAVLEGRFGSHPGVTINRVGLADTAGETVLRHYPSNPTLSTTIPGFPHHEEFEEITVPIRTGEDYTSERGIDHIDLLKIDVEGAEPAVLRGFRPLFEAGQVDVVQFEYGLVAVIDKVLIGDLYRMLEPLGFVVGPLTGIGVLFQPYDLHLELFEYVNWVAVRADRRDLVDRLRAPHSM